MNIEIFNHKVMGIMHVFGDENGLWFWLKDVGECLDIEENTIHFKFKHLNSDLKQVVKCVVTDDNRETNHKFIHEKAVYELMCIGNSEYCDEFRKWISEISYQFDFLNTRCDEAYLSTMGDVQSDFEFIVSVVNKLPDSTPIIKSVKNALDNVEKGLYEKVNGKAVFTDKSYRNDITIDESYSNPNYHTSLTLEEIENSRSSCWDLEKELMKEYINDAIDNNALKEFVVDESLMDYTLDYVDDQEMLRKIEKPSNSNVKYKNLAPSTISVPDWIKKLV